MNKDIDDLLNWIDSKSVVDLNKIKEELISRYEDYEDIMRLVEVCEQLGYQNGLEDGMNKETLK